MEKSTVSTISQVVNFETVNATIENIKKFVKENDYQFKDSTGLDLITDKKFSSALSDLSKKKRKRLAKAMWGVNNYPTLKKINLFLHFLMKNVMKSDVRVRVIPSAKEIAIQEKRKAYKETLAKVKAAYADYKLEKGDFYKIKLAKNQPLQ